MSLLRLHLDEDVWRGLAKRLRLRGFDVTTPHDVGLLASADPTELDFAIRERRALLTHNIPDFARLASGLQAQGKPFPGIVLSAQESRGELLSRTLKLLSRETQESMANRVVWLADYR